MVPVLRQAFGESGAGSNCKTPLLLSGSSKANLVAVTELNFNALRPDWGCAQAFGRVEQLRKWNCGLGGLSGQESNRLPPSGQPLFPRRFLRGQQFMPPRWGSISFLIFTHVFRRGLNNCAPPALERGSQPKRSNWRLAISS